MEINMLIFTWDWIKIKNGDLEKHVNIFYGMIHVSQMKLCDLVIYTQQVSYEFLIK